jgi:hypothetical protein
MAACPSLPTASWAIPNAQSACWRTAAPISRRGTTALVNPDWPRRVKAGLPLATFDHAFLHPIATIRDEECAPV